MKTVATLAAAATIALGAPARGNDIERLYRDTRFASDARTNVQAARAPFPDPRGHGLALSPALERWITTRTARPEQPAFVAAAPPAPAIEAAARAVTEWQGATFGSDDDELEHVWPRGLSPEDLLELKLAVERGADRLTLHHVVSNDLESDEARARFYAALAEPGRRLREARRGPALTIVNTDVDDTVIPSLWDRGRYPRGAPYPGVVELLGAQGDFLVVLTARPVVVSGGTRERFFELFRVRDLDPLRVNISVAPGDTLDIVDTLDMGLRKAETLVSQRRLFPEAASVFNGDSGQGDWIAALALRRLDPEGFSYATIHDVRPWSRAHKQALREELLESDRLEALYRRCLGLPEGALGLADEVRLDRALGKLCADIELALGGPGGRLDGAFLRERGVFLFRNHVELALDLAEAGHLSRAAAERVIAAAARDVRFLPENPFGFDAGGAAALAARLARWAGAEAAPAPRGAVR